MSGWPSRALRGTHGLEVAPRHSALDETGDGPAKAGEPTSGAREHRHLERHAPVLVDRDDEALLAALWVTRQRPVREALAVGPVDDVHHPARRPRAKRPEPQPDPVLSPNHNPRPRYDDEPRSALHAAGDTAIRTTQSRIRPCTLGSTRRSVPLKSEQVLCPTRDNTPSDRATVMPMEDTPLAGGWCGVLWASKPSPGHPRRRQLVEAAGGPAADHGQPAAVKGAAVSIVG